MRAKIRKQKFLFILPLSNREKILIDRLPYTASKHFSSLCMLTLQIFDFFLSRQLTQNIAYWLWIFSPLKRRSMKSRNLLARKLELFYRDIKPKREQIAKNGKLRLQTDLEFRQNELKKLNQKHNIEMFSTHVRRGKAYAAKQKIREFKKLLFRSRGLHKATSTKCFNSRKLIHKAKENMNSVNSQ